MCSIYLLCENSAIYIANASLYGSLDVLSSLTNLVYVRHPVCEKPTLFSGRPLRACNLQHHGDSTPRLLGANNNQFNSTIPEGLTKLQGLE